MFAVISLDGREPAGQEAFDEGFQPALGQLLQHGVGQADRGPQRREGFHGLFGLQDFLGQVGAAVIAQIFLEGLADVLHIALADQHGSDVRAPHALAAGLVQHFVELDLHAQALELFHDADVALAAFSAQILEPVLQGSQIPGQPQAEHMHLAQLRTGRQFASTHEFQPQVTGCRLGFAQAGDRIMIGHRHRRQPLDLGITHELPGAVRSVRGL